MKKIIFLSKDELKDFTCDDDLSIPAIKELGISVETLSWRQSIGWENYDAVIVRSTWDYQDHYDDFIEVLEEINRKTKLINPLSLIKWNSHKAYLRELSQKGVSLIPSLWHEEIESLKFEEIFEKLETHKIIFKPYIGANSDRTYPLLKTDKDFFEEKKKDLKTYQFFVQSFNQNILDEGEFSLFYFDRKFSHAILKTPKKNDYRVQEEWGGLISSYPATDQMIQLGEKIIGHIHEGLLYARVDLVRSPDDSNDFHLMELELIEPALYFRTHPQSSQNFATALKNYLI